MKKKLLVIGNGMASGRMLEHLLEIDPDRFDVTVFNAEPRVNYNRRMLSHVFSGEKTYEDIITHDEQWYQEHGVTLLMGTPVKSIETEQQYVTANSGQTFSYDKLVIATGSNPIMIPLPGHQLPGVKVYRDLDDVDYMMKVAQGSGRVVVIGGGLLGLEAAAGLKERGMDVCVVHLTEHLMDKQLDSSASFLLQQEFERRGIEVRTSTSTTEILGDSHVTGVRFSDGDETDCEMLVMAVGIHPSSSIARQAGIEVNHGIVVDDAMRTSAPNVFALGECVEHQGKCHGLVAPLYDMAKVLANSLTDQQSCFTSSATATKLKVNGVDLYSAGEFLDGENVAGMEDIVLRDAAAGIYKRIILEGKRIVGIVLYGDTEDGSWYFDMLKKQTDISELRDTLVFGQAFQGGASLDPTAAVAALPDDAEICGCNGICKSTITTVITTHSLTTLDAVRAHTKASSSCGTCTTLVERVMQVTLGDTYDPLAVTPVCGCTDLGHDEVRHRIRAEKLQSIQAVLQALEWRSSCGCATCRPALNYYLVSDWPLTYRDDYQSRYINDRVHANIQRDGTYSVAPRMWGGMTNANELRAIADVVDKFDIPAVKMTGGQRIDLLGIEKEDLPAVWSDPGKAGFVSGHTYAKGLRTVKTCVGKDWCRFGTQDSTGLDIQGTEVLGHESTEDEVVIYVAALMQMYREQGHYLERIYKWTKRVGIEEIKDQIMDSPDKRNAYHERFVESQSVSQADPWAERVKGLDAHEFNPLKTFKLQVVA